MIHIFISAGTSLLIEIKICRLRHWIIGKASSADNPSVMLNLELVIDFTVFLYSLIYLICPDFDILKAPY